MKKTRKFSNFHREWSWILFCMPIIFVASIILSICDVKYNWLYNVSSDRLINAIGIGCQIVSSVICCLISILGISFSLQDSEYFGIKINKLFALRIDKHFSFKWSFIISIIILVMNVISYILNWLIMCLGLSIISVIFCIYILCTEIPVMTLNYNSLIAILKSRFITPLKNNDPLEDDFNKAIGYLIRVKSLQVVYNIFKDETNKNKAYNLGLLLKLFNIQMNLITELDIIDSARDRKIFIENARKSSLEVLSGVFNIYEIVGDDILCYSQYVTNVLYKLLNTKWYYKETAYAVADSICFCANIDSLNPKQKDFFLYVTITLITSTVKVNNFELLIAIRKVLSEFTHILSNRCTSTVIFATTSMFLYYMAELETEVPNNVKENIHKFISEDGIEDNTQIISWKNLFKVFSYNYAIDYSDFIRCFHLNQFNLEFMLNSNIAHSCIMTDEFVNFWYLTNLFNSKKLFNYDYSKELYPLTQGHINYFLKQFVKDCYIEKDFTPNERMKKIVAFYDNDKRLFDIFTILEKNNHPFLNYINKLKIDEFEVETKKAANIENLDLTTNIEPMIKSKLNEEWGFSEVISLEEQPLFTFYLRMQKNPENIHDYNGYVADYFCDRIFYELNHYLESKKLYKKINNIDELSVNIMSKDVDTVTEESVYISTKISENNLKEKIEATLKRAKKISSRILPRIAFILEDGFAFNVSIEKFEALDLTLEQLNKEIDKCKRADGQYVYDGVFLSREEVAKYIKNKYIIFQLIFKYAVCATPDSLIVYDYNDNV